MVSRTVGETHPPVTPLVERDEGHSMYVPFQQLLAREHAPVVIPIQLAGPLKCEVAVLPLSGTLCNPPAPFCFMDLTCG